MLCQLPCQPSSSDRASSVRQQQSGPVPGLLALAAVTRAGAFNCFLAGTQDQSWWKQPKWQQLFPAAWFVHIDYRPPWKPTAEIAEFAASFAASAESWDFSSMRSEGRLGHLSQCLCISDSHQIVLWYTQAFSWAGTYPSRKEGSGELLMPSSLWRKGGCLQGDHAIPASCTGLLWWGSSPSSPTGSICFFSPQICCYFWFLSFLQVSWDHFWCHPNHCSFQPLDTAMAALCCFKESWEGSKVLGTLQIKFLPEESKQLLEALGYTNWWEASSLLSDVGAALSSQPSCHTLAQEPKLLHMSTRYAPSPAVMAPFIIFFYLLWKIPSSSESIILPGDDSVLTQLSEEDLMPVPRVWCGSGDGGQQQSHTSAWTAIESFDSTLSGVTGCGSVVEGDAVSEIHFSFSQSYLTLILAAGKIQAKRTCGVLSQYIVPLLLMLHWTGLLRNFFFISKLRMWNSFHFKILL